MIPLVLATSTRSNIHSKAADHIWLHVLGTDLNFSLIFHNNPVEFHYDDLFFIVEDRGQLNKGHLLRAHSKYRAQPHLKEHGLLPETNWSSTLLQHTPGSLSDGEQSLAHCGYCSLGCHAHQIMFHSSNLKLYVW